MGVVCPRCKANNGAKELRCTACGLSLADTKRKDAEERLGWTEAETPRSPSPGQGFSQPDEAIKNGIPLIVISCLLPIAGWVIGAIYMTKPSKTDRKIGSSCLVGATVTFLLAVLFSVL